MEQKQAGDHSDEPIRRLIFDMKELDDGGVVVENYLWGNNTSDEARHKDALCHTLGTWEEAIEYVEGLLAYLKAMVTE